MIVTRGVFLFLLSAKGTGVIGVNVYERNALALGEDVIIPPFGFLQPGWSQGPVLLGLPGSASKSIHLVFFVSFYFYFLFISFFILVFSVILWSTPLVLYSSHLLSVGDMLI